VLLLALYGPGSPTHQIPHPFVVVRHIPHASLLTMATARHSQFDMDSDEDEQVLRPTSGASGFSDSDDDQDGHDEQHIALDSPVHSPQVTDFTAQLRQRDAARGRQYLEEEPESPTEHDVDGVDEDVTAHLDLQGSLLNLGGRDNVRSFANDRRSVPLGDVPTRRNLRSAAPAPEEADEKSDTQSISLNTPARPSFLDNASEHSDSQSISLDSPQRPAFLAQDADAHSISLDSPQRPNFLAGSPTKSETDTQSVALRSPERPAFLSTTDADDDSHSISLESPARPSFLAKHDDDDDEDDQSISLKSPEKPSFLLSGNKANYDSHSISLDSPQRPSFLENSPIESSSALTAAKLHNDTPPHPSSEQHQHTDDVEIQLDSPVAPAPPLPAIDKHASVQSTAGIYTVSDRTSDTDARSVYTDNIDGGSTYTDEIDLRDASKDGSPISSAAPSLLPHGDAEHKPFSTGLSRDIGDTMAFAAPPAVSTSTSAYTNRHDSLSTPISVTTPSSMTYPPRPAFDPRASRTSVVSVSTESSVSKKARPESMLMGPRGPLVLGLALVDFNHLVGPKIEFSEGAICDDEEVGKILPFLALPDGAHLVRCHDVQLFPFLFEAHIVYRAPRTIRTFILCRQVTSQPRSSVSPATAKSPLLLFLSRMPMSPARQCRRPWLYWHPSLCSVSSVIAWE
jgi:hypothetical protein